MSIRLFLTPFALAGALLGGCVAAFAQAAPPPAPAPAQQQGATPPAGADGAPNAPPRHHANVRAALATLDLTSDQQAQVQSFMKSYRASRQTDTPETHKQLMAQIRGVLTPDQQTRFRSAMRAQKQRLRLEQGQDQPQGTPGDSQATPQPQR